MCNKLSVVSCNVNGINCNKKRRAVFEWLKKANHDITFLQRVKNSNGGKNVQGKTCGVGEQTEVEG